MAQEPFLPFSKPSIGREEVEEAVRTLESDWLTTGPRAARFEEDFKSYIGARHALALNSATAALHAALVAAGVGPGDEVITTPMTFVATANVIEMVGARAVFADVRPDTLNLSPEEAARRVTGRTRAILPVHFAGLPCDMAALGRLARRRGLKIIEDAAHAVGAEAAGAKVGAGSYIACFSFHPNKNMTTAEGGMLVTSSREAARAVRLFRFHGVDKEAWKRQGPTGGPHFRMASLGLKYNLTDLQAALGIHQLKKLDGFNRRRRELADLYRDLLSDVDEVELPAFGGAGVRHAWHLFVVRFRTRKISLSRDEIMDRLRAKGIGTGLHYTAVHLHRYYKRKYGFRRGMFPAAEDASDRLASLPLFPRMTDADVERVVGALKEVVIRR